MATDSFESPSQWRFSGFCLFPAVMTLLTVVQFQVNAWLMFPVAILALAILTGVDVLAGTSVAADPQRNIPD
jgi:hypothetical protein